MSYGNYGLNVNLLSTFLGRDQPNSFDLRNLSELNIEDDAHFSLFLCLCQAIGQSTTFGEYEDPLIIIFAKRNRWDMIICLIEKLKWTPHCENKENEDLLFIALDKEDAIKCEESINFCCKIMDLSQKIFKTNFNDFSITRFLGIQSQKYNKYDFYRFSYAFYPLWLHGLEIYDDLVMYFILNDAVYRNLTVNEFKSFSESFLKTLKRKNFSIEDILGFVDYTIAQEIYALICKYGENELVNEIKEVFDSKKEKFNNRIIKKIKDITTNIDINQYDKNSFEKLNKLLGDPLVNIWIIKDVIQNLKGRQLLNFFWGILCICTTEFVDKFNNYIYNRLNEIIHSFVLRTRDIQHGLRSDTFLIWAEMKNYDIEHKTIVLSNIKSSDKIFENENDSEFSNEIKGLVKQVFDIYDTIFNNPKNYQDIQTNDNNTKKKALKEKWTKKKKIQKKIM